MRKQREKEMKRRQKEAELEIERQYDPMKYAIDKQKYDQKLAKQQFEDQQKAMMAPMKIEQERRDYLMK